MLEITQLQYHFPNGAQLAFPDWKVQSGEHSLILGPSGGGKTTLLHLASGLLRPSQGVVKVAGTNLNLLSSSGLDQFRAAHMGFIFQRPHLISALTVVENVRLASFFAKKSIKSKEILDLLAQLGIEDLASRKIHEISQGQAQRVAIARSMINRPDFIFGDEPTASLDDKSCMSVITLLQELAATYRATLIIATHDARVKASFKNRLEL